MELSRRNFLKGAGAAGVAAAAFGLTAPTVEAAHADEAAVPADPRTVWMGEDPEITDDQVSEVYEADVVVVGLSDAGCAAVRAVVEEGGSVIGIDKGEAIVTMGSDISIFGGEIQERFWGDTIDYAEVVNSHQEECGHRFNPMIMQRYCDEIAEVFDMLREADPDLFIADNCFPEFTEEESHHLVIPHRYPLPDPEWDYHNDPIPTFPSAYKINDLKTFMTLNFEKAKAEGDVTDLFGHFVEKLIMEDGRCVGVYARNAADGTYVKALGNKGVILCTGDYSGDETMMRAFMPTLVEHGFKTLWPHNDIEGNPTNTGDGHKLAARVGATVQDFHCASQHSMGGSAGPDGRGVMGINGYLQLNLRGKRFFNEDVPGAQVENQIELQPKKTTYQFFDSSWPEQCKYFPAAHGVVCYYSEGDSSFGINQRCQADIDLAVEEGRALTADTIDELLAQIPEMDTETAKASIERYNELCANGEDVDFHKMARRLFPLENPPFYAVKFEPCLILTCLGGLSSDEDCHTFNADGDIIPGLYAAGNVQGDRFALQKPISVCGLSVGMALFYGVIAGRNAMNGI